MSLVFEVRPVATMTRVSLLLATSLLAGACTCAPSDQAPVAIVPIAPPTSVQAPAPGVRRFPLRGFRSPLIANGDSAIWVDEGGLHELASPDGAVANYALDLRASDLVFDGHTFFAARERGEDILSFGADSKPPVLLAKRPQRLPKRHSLFLAGDQLLFTDRDCKAPATDVGCDVIASIPKGGGPVSFVVTHEQQVFDVFLDGPDLMWLSQDDICGDKVCPTRLRRRDHETGAVTTIFEVPSAALEDPKLYRDGLIWIHDDAFFALKRGTTEPVSLGQLPKYELAQHHFVVDETYVYMSTGKNAWRMPIDGGPWTHVIETKDHIDELVVTPTWLYLVVLEPKDVLLALPKPWIGGASRIAQ